MAKGHKGVWHPWRNRQTRLQLIVAFNVAVGVLWYTCYKKLQNTRARRAIAAPGSYYTKEDLETAGFDVVAVNRRMLEERARYRREAQEEMKSLLMEGEE